MTTLTELLKQGERFVRETLLTHGEKEISPFYHLVGPNGEDALVPCFWETALQKALMVAVVKTVSLKMGAVAALFVCEAWAVSIKRGKSTAPITSINDYKGPAPSEHPDRVEVVQIIATDGNVVEARMLEIKRDWKGEIVDLVEENDMLKADIFMGRMIDGIVPPRWIH